MEDKRSSTLCENGIAFACIIRIKRDEKLLKHFYYAYANEIASEVIFIVIQCNMKIKEH